MIMQARREDLDELRRRNIAVPAVFARGAWLTVALGTPGVELGPSATQLLLWLPVAEPGDSPGPTWAEVEAVIGARGAAGSRTVPAAAAALWAGPPALEVTATGDGWTVHGAELPAERFGNVFWKHGWALGGRAGLLVSLVND